MASQTKTFSTKPESYFGTKFIFSKNLWENSKLSNELLGNRAFEVSYPFNSILPKFWPEKDRKNHLQLNPNLTLALNSFFLKCYGKIPNFRMEFLVIG